MVSCSVIFLVGPNNNELLVLEVKTVPPNIRTESPIIPNSSLVLSIKVEYIKDAIDMIVPNGFSVF